MRRIAMSVGLAGLAAAVAIAIVVLTKGGSKSPPPSAFGFDSHYEISNAESRVNEAILKKLMAQSPSKTQSGGEVRIKATVCRVNPPPPAAHRLLCSVQTTSSEVRPKTTITRTMRWKAVVTISPRTGALALSIGKPIAAGVSVTP